MTLKSVFDRFLPKDGIPPTTSVGQPGMNSLGYRCEEFDRRGPINLQVLGCSWAEGWPPLWPQFSHYTCEELSTYLGVSVGNLNMALGGSSSDYMARTLMCSIDVIKPTAVFFVIPGPDRRDYLRLDGKLVRYQTDFIREEKENGPHWRQFDPVTQSMIRHMNELRSLYDDAMNILKNYKLMEGILNERRIPWGFSFVPHQDVDDILSYFLDAGWVDREHYLGMPYNPVDWTDDFHPGPKSRLLFGQAVFKWFVSAYGSELRAAAANARSANAS